MRIKQDLQLERPSNGFLISSGRGASKSG
jgi:hypothetical protein